MFWNTVKLVAGVYALYCFANAIHQHYWTMKSMNKAVDSRSVAALFLFELQQLLIAIFLSLLILFA